ncbi:hypothetical protein FOA43_000472 [Brettanomyces nanus]|uniref:Uncharacterized protein n=1 Tax=Eeniella nana TaxID=13502 RepID=A0A875RWE3_EENNA|nr:uncharacterized protein FOA43_000472 [Brettanomyces nanus]QPG73166.1 hypothetical protein FOA43_000472 [Brettanomyces nanus]
MSLEVTQQLLSVLSDEITLYKCVQCVADSDVNQDSSLGSLFKAETFPHKYDPKKNILDILVEKSQLAQCFVECYKYLYMGEDGDDKLKYFAALGILLVTPEDHTAMKYVSSIRGPQYQQDFQFRIICAYLTSSIAKTNKSSSLWVCFRRLLVKLMEDDRCNVGPLSRVTLKIILISVKVHPRNYYAFNTLRFLIAMLRDNGDRSLLNYYEASIMEYLKTDGLDDYSMWMALVQLATGLSTEEYYLKEFRRYCSYKWDAEFIEYRYTNDSYSDLVNWLRGSEYKYYSGWYAALIISTNMGNDLPDLEMYFELSYINFENSHSCIIESRTEILRDKNSGDAINLDEDLLLKEKFTKNLAFKKICTQKAKESTEQVS